MILNLELNLECQDFLEWRFHTYLGCNWREILEFRKHQLGSFTLGFLLGITFCFGRKLSHSALHLEDLQVWLPSFFQNLWVLFETSANTVIWSNWLKLLKADLISLWQCYTKTQLDHSFNRYYRQLHNHYKKTNKQATTKIPISLTLCISNQLGLA